MPRRKHDFYETPPHYLDALLSLIDVGGKDIFEPCVGEGMISKRLIEAGADVFTNDIDRKRKADTHKDATSPSAWLENYDWGITNPPFGFVNEITANGLANCTNYVTLARLSFLEPTDDRRVLYDTWGDPDMLIVLPRYSFRENDKGKPATDSVTCAWIGWGPDVPQITTVWTKEPK